MKDLSLNTLDIAENSVKAGARHIYITIERRGPTRTFTVEDDGRGMPPDFLARVTDPFTTTRTTRKVGMGLPLLKLAAEQAGGSLTVRSRSVGEDPAVHGTRVRAVFDATHIDCEPVGDMVSTVVTLIRCHPDIDFTFVHRTESGEARLDTAELRAVLGDVPLDTYEVTEWITESLSEQYEGMGEDT